MDIGDKILNYLNKTISLIVLILFFITIIYFVYSPILESNGILHLGYPSAKNIHANFEGRIIDNLTWNGITNDNTIYLGSSIRWNKNYIVTAKHISKLENVSYVAKGDFVFIYNPAKNLQNKPFWRNPKNNEKVYAFGTPNLLPYYGYGLIIPYTIFQANENYVYSATDAAATPGIEWRTNLCCERWCYSWYYNWMET